MTGNEYQKLVYFSDAAILNREVKLIGATTSGHICVTLK